MKDKGIPTTLIPALFTAKLEAGPGPKCSLRIVLEVSSHRCQPPTSQTCLTEAESWVNDDGGHVVGPAKLIDRGLAHLPH